MGITVTLKFHSLSTCNLNSSYFMIFYKSFALMLWSPDTAVLIILHSFSPCQSSQCQASYVLFQYLSVMQSPMGFCILHFSFSSPGSGWWECHFSPHSISNFLQRASGCFCLLYFAVFYTNFRQTTARGNNMCDISFLFA